MKKSILLVGVLLSAMAYASSDTIVPIEVERNINKFYQDSDFSQRNQYANMQRKAYISSYYHWTISCYDRSYYWNDFN